MAKNVYVRIDSEDEPFLIEMTPAQAKRAKALLDEAQDTQEWPEEVNEIIDSCKRVPIVAVISTFEYGEWIEQEDEE